MNSRAVGAHQGNAGSFNYLEQRVGQLVSGLYTPGYVTRRCRRLPGNNRLQQKNAVGDFRWTDGQGTNAYFNLAGDMQRLGLPGGRLVDPTLNLVELDPRGATTPFDFANKQGVRTTLGVTRQLAPGTELIVDGGMRQKNQQAAFFCSGCPDFDSGFKATLTNVSLTPRVASQHTLGAMPGKLLAGVDLYDTLYGSDRSQHLGDAPIHRYDLTQRVAGAYFMETIGVLPTTDFGFGARGE